jgi:hypothetical protein
MHLGCSGAQDDIGCTDEKTGRNAGLKCEQCGRSFAKLSCFDCHKDEGECEKRKYCKNCGRSVPINKFSKDGAHLNW